MSIYLVKIGERELKPFLHFHGHILTIYLNRLYLPFILHDYFQRLLDPFATYDK